MSSRNLTWRGGLIESRHDYQALRDSLVMDPIPYVLYDGEPKYRLLWNGVPKAVRRTSDDTRDPLRMEDFTDRSGHLYLHPIEVLIVPSVVEKMRKLATSISNYGKTKIETGGYLAGRFEEDRGRHYTIVEYACGSENYVGTATSFKYTHEMKEQMNEEIASLGLFMVGFWHSHPTYAPFLSDERTHPQYGADVQATLEMARAPWDVAVVIDPFPEHWDQYSGRGEADSGGALEGASVSIGCYKINGRHTDLGRDSSDMEAAWRSVGFAIKSVRPFSDLVEQEGDSIGLSEFEIEYYSAVVRDIADKVVSEGSAIRQGPTHLQTEEEKASHEDSLNEKLRVRVRHELMNRKHGDAHYTLLPRSLSTKDLDCLIDHPVSVVIFDESVERLKQTEEG